MYSLHIDSDHNKEKEMFMNNKLKCLIATTGILCSMAMTSLAAGWVGDSTNGWIYINDDGTTGNYLTPASVPNIDGVYAFSYGLQEGVGNYYTINPELQTIILMRKDPDNITVFMDNQTFNFTCTEETMYFDEWGNGQRGLEVYDNGTLDLYLDNRNIYTNVQ